MRLLIFSVRDRATDQFGTPVFLMSAGQAIRWFSDEVNRNASDNQLYAHPDDFDLYELGSYDSDKGTFEVNGGPSRIALGKQVKLAS